MCKVCEWKLGTAGTTGSHLSPTSMDSLLSVQKPLLRYDCNKFAVTVVQDCLSSVHGVYCLVFTLVCDYAFCPFCMVNGQMKWMPKTSWLYEYRVFANEIQATSPDGGMYTL